ncbi:MAG TPA: nucleotidyltransferase domain-containing protein [Clostridiales bacterium]|nr:nucleotidyltransferase domain-containing protein [Clostridiales bacterium]
MGINDIIAKYNLRLLLIFGSYNTDRFTENSDIDLAYLSDRNLNIEEEMELLMDMVVHFMRDGIDLVNLNKADPLLSFQIACNSKVLYEENNSYILFKMKASARYADTKHLRVLRRKFLQEQLKSSGYIEKTEMEVI